MGDEQIEVLFTAPEVCALIGEGHREIALAGTQRSQGLRWFGLGESDLDLGEPFLDQSQGAGDHRRRGRGEGHQPDPPGAQPGDRGNFLLGGSQRRQHANCVPRKDLAGLGQAHVAPDPLDQNGPASLLEAANHLRDGGLGVAQ